MPKKESKGESGKRAAWCALCVVGIYLALQVLGALLVSREVVGEDRRSSWLQLRRPLPR